MSFIALQEFQPQERESHGTCIWCGRATATNRAHIISRKLATGSPNSPVLRFTVCNKCNSVCGKLERWILQFTPLAWVRMMLYLSPRSESTSRHIPSYFFSLVLNDWVVFYLDGITRSYVIPTQLLLLSNSNATLLTQAPQGMHEQLMSHMIAALRDNKCIGDVRTSLPKEFSPRILLNNETHIVIARTDADLKRFTEEIQQFHDKPSNRQRLRLEPSGQERFHFQWSKANWSRFCAKIALETLCLFEGGHKCISPAFRLVREFVLSGTTKMGREIVFDEKGPRNITDVPSPVIVDLTSQQDAPQPVTALLPHSEPGTHMVILYEVRGWVLASVVIAGFPSSVMVLAGPNEHLDDMYMMIFDYQDAMYHFLHLASNKNEPIIPFPVAGDHLLDLAETYRLVGV